MPKRSLKITVAYDGTGYAGWQVQPDAKTIQGTLEDAWARVTGERIRLTASGRTDAGVHALGQVVSLQTATHLDNDSLQRALCAILPDDIAVLSVEDAVDDFHAIRNAVSKRYRYRIDNGRVRDVLSRRYTWHVPAPLDAEAMHRAAQRLVGRHDFSSFESAGAERASSVRTVSELLVQRGRDERCNEIVLEIESDGFLYNMVRAIVGTLVEVGRGAQREDWISEVLAAVDRRRAGPTAPPQGLVLLRVTYR